jgi:peptide/nickel transport system ATP-binding protein
MAKLRRDIQFVFQDPFSSLNLRLSIATNIAEPLRAHGATWAVRRERVAIAHALALDPQLVIADEPVSALDLSVPAQVLNLLLDLQQRRSLAYLFMAHDLAVVRYVSRRTVVM